MPSKPSEKSMLADTPINDVKFFNDRTLEGYQHLSDWRADRIFKATSFICRHDTNAPSSNSGKVPMDYVMKKLGERRDDVRLLHKHQVLATLATNYRFLFFGGMEDDLASTNYVACAQGHSKEVDLETIAREFTPDNAPVDLMRRTNYSNLGGIL